MKKRRWVYIGAILATIILGTAGYMTADGSGWYLAFLGSLDFLRVKLGALPPSWMLETARWIGIFLFFSILLEVLSSFIEGIRLFFWCAGEMP